MFSWKTAENSRPKKSAEKSRHKKVGKKKLAKKVGKKVVIKAAKYAARKVGKKFIPELVLLLSWNQSQTGLVSLKRVIINLKNGHCIGYNFGFLIVFLLDFQNSLSDFQLPILMEKYGINIGSK